MEMTNLPTKQITLADGHKFSPVELRNFTARIVDATKTKNQATADIRGHYADAAKAGLDKKAIKALIKRHNRKQFELDLEQLHVHAYEEACGWRDGLLDPVDAMKDAKEETERAEASTTAQSEAGTGSPAAAIEKGKHARRGSSKPRKAGAAARATSNGGQKPGTAPEAF